MGRAGSVCCCPRRAAYTVELPFPVWRPSSASMAPALRQVGGNIGYDVRPSRRNQSYATRMLALMLARAREAGLDGVLLTVDVDNIASARVIEKNGGVRDGAAAHVGVRLRTWACALNGMECAY